MAILMDGMQLRSYSPPEDILLLLGCKHVSMRNVAWIQTGGEAPLSALLVMTTLKKAGPCSALPVERILEIEG